MVADVRCRLPDNTHVFSDGAVRAPYSHLPHRVSRTEQGVQTIFFPQNLCSVDHAALCDSWRCYEMQ